MPEGSLTHYCLLKSDSQIENKLLPEVRKLTYLSGLHPFNRKSRMITFIETQNIPAMPAFSYEAATHAAKTTRPLTFYGHYSVDIS